MISLVRLLFVAFVLAGNDTAMADQEDVASRVAALVSSKAKTAIQEVARARRELRRLPRPGSFATSSQIGFHSLTMSDSNAPLSMQVDLGGNFPISAVGLVPVGMDSTRNPDAGYGFPRRFKVEASLRADFAYSLIVENVTAADFPNPGSCPVLLKAEQQIVARYLRLTVTKHYPAPDGWVTALGELIAVSDGRNVARGRPVTLVTGKDVFFPPAWRTGNLTDGHSILGPAVSVGDSPANGYLSANAGSADEKKWLQIDFGGSVKPSEILLVPARPTDVADNPGIGFPVRFRVLAGYNADFRDYHVLLDQTAADLPNPGENPVILFGGNQYFRFLRVEVNRLWERGETRVFALAEIEAFEKGVNRAHGASVTVSDSYQGPRSRRWAPDSVTDGFSSRHPLVKWEDHLVALDERRRTELGLAEWTARRDETVDQVLGGTVLFGGGTFVFLIGALVSLRWQHRRAAKKVAREIRQQIASDLHDEVGSNLGSIALLAQTGEGKSDQADLCANKFREISATARETAESMRDIVWMLQAGNSNTLELRRQMAAAARLIGEGMELELVEESDIGRMVLPLDFTRNVYLLCKEALSNARRHSGANRLEVMIRFDRGELMLHVIDDGKGFDSASKSAGNGLGNLRDRAGSVGGELAIESEPEKGTRIAFQVTLPKS